MAGLAVSMLTAGLLAISPSPSAQQPSPAALKVVATTAMIGDAAKAIGGERIELDVLLGEGVDPHLYKPTRTDIVRLTRADLVLANGLHLEAQMDDTFAQIGKGKPVVFVAEALPKDRLLADPAYPDRKDPHVWMDPELWTVVAGAVRDALTSRDPAGANAYNQGHARYVAELGKLSAYAKRILDSVPADRRVLLTAHDAFNYFGRAYGYEVLGVQSVSTESEAGLKRIEEIVKLVVSRKLPAIFVESSVSDRTVRAVIEGAAARGHQLAVGAQLFSDAMGKPATHQGTYLGMIDHNVTGIARALGGEAPERGMVDKLGSGS